jgi:hypothetical protein
MTKKAQKQIRHQSFSLEFSHHHKRKEKPPQAEKSHQKQSKIIKGVFPPSIHHMFWSLISFDSNIPRFFFFLKALKE